MLDKPAPSCTSACPLPLDHPSRRRDRTPFPHYAHFHRIILLTGVTRSHSHTTPTSTESSIRRAQLRLTILCKRLVKKHNCCYATVKTSPRTRHVKFQAQSKPFSNQDLSPFWPKPTPTPAVQLPVICGCKSQAAL
jgi:hypothetical protein